jgi:capsular polysaccharide biosynthesis protein
MPTLREATNPNRKLRPNVLRGMAAAFILALAVFVTMFLIAVMSVA